MPDISPETATLRAALDAAQRSAEAERTKRLEIEGRLAGETKTRFAAQEQAVDTQITQAETTAASLQAKWANLQAEGKFEEAAVAMREMSDTSARLAQLKGQKQWLDQQRQVTAAQPTDAMAQFNDTERDWITRNPRYLNDPAFMRKVNAAATHAVEFEGLVKDSPEYWQHIESKVYPERATTQQPAQGQGEGEGQGQDATGAPQTDWGTDDALQQQHTVSVPISQPSVDAPAMSIDANPDDTQAPPRERAVGKGGNGVRAVAAPPSRRIREVSNRLAGGAQRIEPTQKEYEVARALYDTIEPNAQDRSDDTVIRWYHALYNSPTHRLTNRRRWVFEGAQP